MSSTRKLLERNADQFAESLGTAGTGAGGTLPAGLAVPPKLEGRRPLWTAGTLPLGKLAPDPDQPRKHFDEEDLGSLARSIADRGQLVPVSVRWEEGESRWVILDGERRYRAKQRLGHTHIDCLFSEKDYTRSRILEEQLIANCLREDLLPLEEARAYRELMGFNGWTGEELAKVLGVSTFTVSLYLALLKMPPDLQREVDAGELPVSKAYEISKLRGAALQRELAGRAQREGLSLREVKQIVQTQKGKASRRREGKPRELRSPGQKTHHTTRGVKVTVVPGKDESPATVREALLDLAAGYEQPGTKGNGGAPVLTDYQARKTEVGGRLDLVWSSGVKVCLTSPPEAPAAVLEEALCASLEEVRSRVRRSAEPSTPWIGSGVWK